jgi:hypothetical protein
MRLNFTLGLVVVGLVFCGKPPEQSGTGGPAETRSAGVTANAAVAATPTACAGTQVTVKITGLVSIADTAEMGSGGKLKSKMLYAVDASGAQHRAVVMAHEDYYQSSPRTVTTVKNVFKLVDLTGDLLAFDGVDPAANELSYDDTEPASVCPTEQQKASLYFFPKISRVVPKTDNGKILEASDLHAPHVTPTPGTGPIAGWIKMSFGGISASHKSGIVWDFREPPPTPSYGSTYRQLIAQEAWWTFCITTSTLKLVSTKTGASETVMELKPNGQGVIELYIANATSTGIDAIADGTSARHEPVDIHFIHYYDYFTKYKNDPRHPRYVPIAAGVCVGTTLNTTPCAIYSQVKITRPPNCPEVEEAGDTNCGPDGLP